MILYGEISMVYEKNMSLLKMRESFIYDRIVEGNVDWDNDKAVCSTAKNGEYIIGYNKGDSLIYFNSRYNPSREVERFMEPYISMPDKAVMIMFGLGNLEYVEYFLTKNQKDNFCVIFEPSIDIFMKILHSIDMSKLLKDERVSLIVQGINEEFLGNCLMERLSSYNIKTNHHVILPQYVECFSEKYDYFHEVIRDKYLNLQIEINTFKVMGDRMCYTAIHNMRYIPGCRCAMDYVGKFPENMPAIIVSAGPSLEKNVELLKEAKGKAFILVVDTAIRKVLSKGIEPDAIISVDNSKLLDNFKVDGIQDIFFFGDMSMNTDVLDLVKPINLVFYSSDSPVWAKMFRDQGSEIFTIYSGGSVALDALTLLIVLGFKRIILTGQDLALTGNRQYAHGGEISFDDIPGGVIYVKDIYGNDVPTKKDYFNFIKNFEQIAVTNPEIEIIDATEGGAKIEHTNIMSLREAIDKYCTVECNIEELLESAPRLFAGDNKSIVLEKLNEMKNNIRNLGKQMAQVAADCRLAADMLSRKEYNISKLKQINSKMKKLDELYVELDEHILIRKYVAMADYEFSGDVYVEGSDQIGESIRMYEKSEKLYDAIAKAAPKIVKIVDDTIEKIKK